LRSAISQKKLLFSFFALTAQKCVLALQAKDFDTLLCTNDNYINLDWPWFLFYWRSLEMNDLNRIAFSFSHQTKPSRLRLFI